MLIAGTSQPGYAASNENFFELVLSILSYSQWSNTTHPTICIIDNSEIASQLQHHVQQHTDHYQVKAISAKDFQKSDCHVVYFSKTPPEQQQSLIQSYPSKSLLSISINNPDCEIGSTFCLYHKKGLSTFQINLDALSYSTVHIDPRVLLLAKDGEPNP